MATLKIVLSIPNAPRHVKLSRLKLFIFPGLCVFSGKWCERRLQNANVDYFISHFLYVTIILNLCMHLLVEVAKTQVGFRFMILLNGFFSQMLRVLLVEIGFCMMIQKANMTYLDDFI